MIIVTGAAGFIGSNVIHALNQQGETDILAVDRLRDGEKWRNLNGLKYLVYLEADDFYRKIEEGARFGDPKAVLHLGACSSTIQRDVGYLAENNLRCTQRLCLWALKNDYRFITASSAATYGDGAQGFSDCCDLDSLRPLNAYGWSKHAFDLWAKRGGLLDQLVSLKFFNVYGPNEYHKGAMRSGPMWMWEQAGAGPVRLFRSHHPDVSDGEQARDFVYVKDVALIVLKFLDSKANGIYNVGAGEARTWNAVASAVFAAMRSKWNVEYVDMPVALRGNYQGHTLADTDKLRSEVVGDFTFTSIEDGVEDYVRHYLVAGMRRLT